MKEIHRGLFLLSPRAIRILQIYVLRQSESTIGRTTIQISPGRSSLIMRMMTSNDTAQRDLGAPGLWLTHRKAAMQCYGISWTTSGCRGRLRR
jgi:hypothetical protein